MVNGLRGNVCQFQTTLTLTRSYDAATRDRRGVEPLIRVGMPRRHCLSTFLNFRTKAVPAGVRHVLDERAERVVAEQHQTGPAGRAGPLERAVLAELAERGEHPQREGLRLAAPDLGRRAAHLPQLRQRVEVRAAAPHRREDEGVALAGEHHHRAEAVRRRAEHQIHRRVHLVGGRVDARHQLGRRVLGRLRVHAAEAQEERQRVARRSLGRACSTRNRQRSRGDLRFLLVRNRGIRAGGGGTIATTASVAGATVVGTGFVFAVPMFVFVL